MGIFIHFKTFDKVIYASICVPGVSIIRVDSQKILHGAKKPFQYHSFFKKNGHILQKPLLGIALGIANIFCSSKF